jgi:hypothetical protein
MAYDLRLACAIENFINRQSYVLCELCQRRLSPTATAGIRWQKRLQRDVRNAKIGIGMSHASASLATQSKRSYEREK